MAFEIKSLFNIVRIYFIMLQLRDVTSSSLKLLCRLPFSLIIVYASQL